MIQSRKYHRRHHYKNEEPRKTDWNVYQDFYKDSNHILEFKKIPEYGRVFTLKGVDEDSFKNRVDKNGFVCSYYNKTTNSILLHSGFLTRKPDKTKKEKPFDSLDYKVISVYLSKDTKFGFRQNKESFGRGTEENKYIMTKPIKLNNYLHVTKGGNITRYLNGWRGGRYCKEIINAAKFVKKLLDKNRKTIVIVQSHNGDLATAVSAFVHVLYFKANNNKDIDNFLIQLVSQEFHHSTFRLFYHRNGKNIQGLNAVALSFIGALQKEGISRKACQTPLQIIQNGVIKNKYERYTSLLLTGYEESLINRYKQHYTKYNKTCQDIIKHGVDGVDKERIDELIRIGVPDEQRKYVWPLLANVKNMELEYPGYPIDPKDIKIPENQRSVIERDSHGIPLLDVEYRESFIRILQNFRHNLKDQKGYIQGMGFFLLPLLISLNEKDAYYTYMYIMHSKKVNTYNNFGNYSYAIEFVNTLLYMVQGNLGEIYDSLYKYFENIANYYMFQSSIINPTYVAIVPYSNDKEFIKRNLEGVLYFGDKYTLFFTYTLLQLNKDKFKNKGGLKFLESYFSNKQLEQDLNLINYRSFFEKLYDNMNTLLYRSYLNMARTNPIIKHENLW